MESTKHGEEVREGGAGGDGAGAAGGTVGPVTQQVHRDCKREYSELVLKDEPEREGRQEREKANEREGRETETETGILAFLY